jgi:23S rRNA (cytosine1962-C5)-methyltransferase
MMPPVRPAVFPHPGFPDYQLVDSGEGEKLERLGPVTLVRPDPQALWKRRLPAGPWRGADLVFERESDRGGRWRAGEGAPSLVRSRAPEWPVRWEGAVLLVRPTPFKHVGVFPEQAANWRWLADLAPRFGDGPRRLLNLFGYTGAASIVAARAGYDATHVDASRTSLTWARDNARASEVEEGRIRFLLEDARAFVQREVRRGSRYAGVLIDPPHYGRGPGGEKWQLEDHLAELVDGVARILAERAFVCLSVYAVGFLPLALAGLLQELGPGAVEAGELALPEEHVAGAPPPRLLSSGMCARFSRGLLEPG